MQEISFSSQALGYHTPTEVYGAAVGTSVALRDHSVPTALIHGDEPALETPVLCFDNRQGYILT